MQWTLYLCWVNIDWLLGIYHLTVTTTPKPRHPEYPLKWPGIWCPKKGGFTILILNLNSANIWQGDRKIFRVRSNLIKDQMEVHEPWCHIRVSTRWNLSVTVKPRPDGTMVSHLSLDEMKPWCHIQASTRWNFGVIFKLQPDGNLDVTFKHRPDGNLGVTLKHWSDGNLGVTFKHWPDGNLDVTFKPRPDGTLVSHSSIDQIGTLMSYSSLDQMEPWCHIQASTR